MIRMCKFAKLLMPILLGIIHSFPASNAYHIVKTCTALKVFVLVQKIAKATVHIQQRSLLYIFDHALLRMCKTFYDCVRVAWSLDCAAWLSLTWQQSLMTKTTYTAFNSTLVLAFSMFNTHKSHVPLSAWHTNKALSISLHRISNL